MLSLRQDAGETSASIGSRSVSVATIGLLLSLACCIPYAITFLFSSYLSPAVFQDWDEPVYIILMKRIGGYSLSDLWRDFPATPANFPYLPRFYAHSLPDVMLGKLLNLTSLDPLSFLIILDLLSVFSTYYAFFKLFSLLTNPSAAKIAALFSVGFPFLPSSFEGWLLLDLGSAISAAGLGTFPSIPAMRGIYTQLSASPFIFCLTAFITLIVGFDPKFNFRRVLASGAIFGLVVYLYAFAWIALISLVATITGFLIVFNFKRSKHLTFTGITIILSSLLVAMPGILLNVSMRPVVGLEKGIGGPFPFWLPLDYLFLLGIIFSLGCFYKQGDRGLWALLFAAVVVTEVALGNLEAVTQQIWTSYHFALFFLRPILSGLIVIPLFEPLKFGSAKWPNIVTPLALILLFGAIHSFKAYSSYSYTSPQIDLFKALVRDLPEGAVLASPALSTENPAHIEVLIEPFHIDSILNRSVFFAQKEFRQLFPDQSANFNLLRIALMNRGVAPEFCKFSDSENLKNNSSTPIHAWGMSLFIKECQRLPAQLTKLCQNEDWTWFPTHLITDERQLNIRARVNRAEQAKTQLPGDRFLLKLSHSDERDVICNSLMRSTR